MKSPSQVLPLFLPSCQGKFLRLSEAEKKVYKRFQRFPQAIIQAGEREEEEEAVDDSDVEKEGTEENVDQPSLEEPGKQEAQFAFHSLSVGFLSLGVGCLLEDFCHPLRELVLLALSSC